MGLNKLDSNRTLSATRQDYVLPVCPVSGATVTYRGNDWSELQTIEIDLSGQSVTITQATSAGFGSVKILDFLAGLGNVAIVNAAIYGTVTTGANSGATEALLVSLGSAAAATDGDLTSTEVTHLPKTSTTIAARTGTVAAVATAVTFSAAQTSATAVHLNFAQAANVGGASSVTLGTGFKVILTYNVAAKP
jgi:hypothetical protein